MRSTILVEAPRAYAQLVDALTKLGEEEDAYHATCLIVIEYADTSIAEEEPDLDSTEQTDSIISGLPSFTLRRDAMPERLSPEYFLEKIVNRVLETTPNEYHTEARKRRGLKVGGVPEG